MSDDEGVQNVAKTDAGDADEVFRCKACGTLRSTETPLCEICYPRNADTIRAPFSLNCDGCGRPGPTTRAEAVRYGWTKIKFDPDSYGTCYSGFCQLCRQENTG